MRLVLSEAGVVYLEKNERKYMKVKIIVLFESVLKESDIQ